MRVYFAPLDGVTDALFRRVHFQTFSGVDKYFIPFVSPSQSMSFTVRENTELSPRANAGVPVVPQVLARDADLAVAMTRFLRDAGYGEVNLNLGCPSGTVTGKGKGAAMLRNLEELRRFLDRVYANAALPVSIKTRIGFDTDENWPRLLELYRQYPVHELIVHPRTRAQAYTGEARREVCAEAGRLPSIPFVYNGDLFTAEDCRALQREYPGVTAVMLGRGLAANPALAREIAGGPGITLEELRLFHDRLYRAYAQSWPETAAVGRMHLMMQYLSHCFQDPEKPRKAIRRATRIDEYDRAVSGLFDGCALKACPAYQPGPRG
ncbi:MAG: tRNA-dihydrouridine synthase family protein [Candidatus Limiplasma sp.]|nr:tRNA-dihydrouridine synthase family protein [Candidatus Limiplasma sp.]